MYNSEDKINCINIFVEEGMMMMINLYKYSAIFQYSIPQKEIGLYIGNISDKKIKIAKLKPVNINLSEEICGATGGGMSFCNKAKIHDFKREHSKRLTFGRITMI